MHAATTTNKDVRTNVIDNCSIITKKFYASLRGHFKFLRLQLRGKNDLLFLHIQTRYY